MATTWGSIDDHLRVGINITQSPSSVTWETASVTLTVKYYVGNDSLGWSFSDTQTLTRTGAITGSTSFTNSLGPDANDTQLVVTKTLTVNLTGSTQSKTFGASISGAYNGATPSHSRSWTVPAQPAPPAVVPSAPVPPTISSTDWTGATTAPIVQPDSGTASVDSYQVQVATSTAFTTIIFDQTYSGANVDLIEANGLTTTNSSPSTTYYMRIRAHNSVGWGSYSTASGAPFTTTAAPTGNTFYVKVDDVWVIVVEADYKISDAWEDISEQDYKRYNVWDI